MKKIFLIIIILAVVGLGIYYFLLQNNKNTETPKTNPITFEIQGMKVEILKEGTGEVAKNGDTISVHYTGTLENGTKFDSSLDRGVPFSFTLGEGRVIKGWDLGVLGMKVGEKRKLIIPAELGYGEPGRWRRTNPAERHSYL